MTIYPLPLSISNFLEYVIGEDCPGAAVIVLCFEMGLLLIPHQQCNGVVQYRLVCCDDLQVDTLPPSEVCPRPPSEAAWILAGGLCSMDADSDTP